jgi:hypothetical protein
MTITDMPDATLAARLQARADDKTRQQRRDNWRRTVGLNGNGHGQITQEPQQ